MVGVDRGTGKSGRDTCVLPVNVYLSSPSQVK